MVCSPRACIEERRLVGVSATVAVYRFTNTIVSTSKSLRRRNVCLSLPSACETAHMTSRELAQGCQNHAGHPPPTPSIFMLESTSTLTHRTSILHERHLINHVRPREGSVQSEGVRSVGCIFLPLLTGGTVHGETTQQAGGEGIER